MEPKVVAIPQSIHEEGLEFGGVFQGGLVHDGLVLQLLAQGGPVAGGLREELTFHAAFVLQEELLAAFLVEVGPPVPGLEMIRVEDFMAEEVQRQRLDEHGAEGFEEVQGQNIRPYAPVELRLFSFRDGCYYFIGDPTDFGYAGNTFSYYGAHPILATYGGGWCFMIGPHRHFWRPWSPLFVTVGPWFYWEGPFDPFFWTYWPYYHFYYRSHYPHYYARGAFFRGHAVAPRITTVPRPQRYGSAWHGAGGAYRAGPMAPQGAAPAPGPAYRAPPATPHTSGGGAHFGGGGRFRR